MSRRQRQLAKIAAGSAAAAAAARPQADLLDRCKAIASERRVITDAIRALQAGGWCIAPEAEVIRLVAARVPELAGVPFNAFDAVDLAEVQAIARAAVAAFVEAESNREDTRNLVAWEARQTKGGRA